MKVSKIFKGDRTIWVVFLLLSIVSLVEVYSSIGLFAYSSSGGGWPTGLFLKHLLIVVATWVVVIAAVACQLPLLLAVCRAGLLDFCGVAGCGADDGWPLVPHACDGPVPALRGGQGALVLFVARMLALKKDQVGETRHLPLVAHLHCHGGCRSGAPRELLHGCPDLPLLLSDDALRRCQPQLVVASHAGRAAGGLSWLLSITYVATRNRSVPTSQAKTEQLLDVPPRGATVSTLG